MTFVEDPRTAPALRWGVLGPGSVAHRFARETRAHTAQTVVAVGSRDRARAAGFAAEHGIEVVHDSYAALVDDPRVDVVYVATPHSEHLANALLAVEAGKHVLVEKPATRNAEEARALAAAARAAGVFAMEALWSRFLPHMIELKAAVDRGELGDVVALSADHGQPLDLGPSHRMLDPDLAGGALLDLGVYPLSFAHLMLGRPDEVAAVGALTETGVDGQAAVVLSYGARARAVLETTLWASTPCTAWIAGDAGRVEVERTFYAPTEFRLTRTDGRSWHYDGRVPGGFQYQVAEVARCVADGRQQSPLRSWDDTIEVMQVLDAARACLGVAYPGESA